MESKRLRFGSKIIVARDNSFVTFPSIEEAVSDATKLAAQSEFGSADFVVYEIIEHRRKVSGSKPLDDGNPSPRDPGPKRFA